MTIIKKNTIFYHATENENFKLNCNSHIWLSEKSNYSRFVYGIDYNNIKIPIVNLRIKTPLSNSNIYIFKNLRNLKLIEIGSETLINYFYYRKYDFYRYCNLKNIDGIYSNNSYYQGKVYLLYIHSINDYFYTKLPKKLYPDNISLKVRLYYSIKSWINLIIFYIIYFLHLEKLNSDYKNILNYKQIINNFKTLNNNFLKNIKNKYLEDFQKKKYNFNISLPKHKNLRICTYNIYNYNFPTLNGNINSINDTFSFINNINPDILCLQESYSLNNNLDKIKLNCNYKYSYSIWNTSSLSKYKSKFKSIKLPYSGIFDLYRFMIIQYIEEFNIWIFNVHLDPFTKSGNVRKEQIKYILNKIYKISNFKRSILLGDFNTLNFKDYSDKKLYYMKRFEPDFLSNNDLGDIPLYFTDSISKYNIINPETSIYKKRVDYIFISKDMNFHSSCIIPYTTSDHLPVIIDL